MISLQEHLNQSLYISINENIIWNALKKFWKWLTDESSETFKDTNLSELDSKDFSFNHFTFSEYLKKNKSIRSIMSLFTKNINYDILEATYDEEVAMIYCYVSKPVQNIKVSKNLTFKNAINIIGVNSNVENLDDRKIIELSLQNIIKNMNIQNNQKVDGFLFSNNDFLNKTLIQTLNCNKLYKDGKGNEYYYMKYNS